MRTLAIFVVGLLCTNMVMATNVSCTSLDEPLPFPNIRMDKKREIPLISWGPNSLCLENSIPVDVCPEGVSAPLDVKKITADWDPLGNGLSDDCYAIVFDGNGNLIAGGGFNSAGGNAANNVALWDGTNWNPLGAGTNGTILDMELDNAGNLFVGGLFTTAGGNAASNIAMWDGTNWTALGTGLDGGCTELTSDNAGNLYAVGRFTTAGGVAANRIAVWDGATWSTLGTGFNGNTEAVIFDAAGNLYVGGSFNTAGGNAINNLAVWDGTTWGAVGGGVNRRCYQLLFDPAGDLYASGEFTMAGAVAANRIAKWDGTTWTTFGAGFNNTVWAMEMTANGDLYVGGFFTKATANPGDRIAVWDGTAWSEPGGGVGNSVAVIEEAPNGNLYVGGDFIKFTPSGLIRKIMVWCTAVLSLDLAFFEADFWENKTTLTWAKSYEDGSKDFEVEHSRTGISWETLAHVESNLRVYQETEYSYVHKTPLPGLNYYRLKQVDENGDFVYSDVVEVLVNPEIEIYPNPAKDKITVRGIDIQNASLHIRDSSGKLLRKGVLSAPELDISDLPTGIYFLSLQKNKKSYEFKVVKE